MTIRVPYELGTEFINQADREGRDVSAVAAESFNMYLDDKQKWRAADRKVRRRASGGEAS